MGGIEPTTPAFALLSLRAGEGREEAVGRAGAGLAVLRLRDVSPTLSPLPCMRGTA